VPAHVYHYYTRSKSKPTQKRFVTTNGNGAMHDADAYDWQALHRENVAMRRGAGGGIICAGA